MKTCRIVTASVLLGLLAACASAPVHNRLALWEGSPNHEPRRARVIVLHHTAMDSAQAAITTLQTGNSGGPVSSHYVIGEDGRIYQLVAEEQRAWHAGDSSWAGISDLNSYSIGIELDNNGNEPFSAPQIDALLVLLKDLTTRLRIQRHLVVGHGDVAPTNKDDPSRWFPWQTLARSGFGLWPGEYRATPPVGFDPWAALRMVGYDLRDRRAALAAFHRHFRDGDSDGTAWLPGDAGILYDLQLQLMREPLPATWEDRPTH